MLQDPTPAWFRARALLLLPLAATLVWGGCGRRLSHYEKKSARRSLSQLKKVQSEFKATEGKLKALIAQDKAFMSKAPTVKRARTKLSKVGARLKEIENLALRMTRILDKNKGTDTARLRRMTRELDAAMKKTRLKLVGLVRPVATLRYAKKNAKTLIRQVKKTRTRIGSYPPPPVSKRVAKASKKYPQAADDIKARLLTLKGKKLLTLADGFDAAQKNVPPDYLAMGRLASRLRTKWLQLSGDRKKLLTHLDELDDHVDLILVDMKQERIRFFHKYKAVRGRKWKRTAWKPVSATFFRRHADHLGMALYAKPKGTFHTKANTVASPPGYLYVGLKEYGKWNVQGTEKTWKFHPQYKYMLAMFFAGTAAVTYAAFHSFRKSRMRGVVWFGLAGAIWYGTRSSRMRRQYKHYYARKARLRKARLRRTRRTRTRRHGRSSRRGK